MKTDVMTFKVEAELRRILKLLQLVMIDQQLKSLEN